MTSVSVSPRSLAASHDEDGECTIVWLRGEHDAWTVPAVTEALREAVVLDAVTVVVDLSDVGFVGAAIIGVLVEAEILLREQARTLKLRRPSRCARRALELCGRHLLPEPLPLIEHATGPVGALATWVPIRTLDPIPQQSTSSESDATPWSPGRRSERVSAFPVSNASVRMVDFLATGDGT